MAKNTYEITLTLGDVEFLREVVDFAEDLLDAVDMQDFLATDPTAEDVE